MVCRAGRCSLTSLSGRLGFGWSFVQQHRRVGRHGRAVSHESASVNPPPRAGLLVRVKIPKDNGLVDYASLARFSGGLERC